MLYLLQLDKCRELRTKLENCDKKLSNLREEAKNKMSVDDNDDGDALDKFMSNLGKQGQSISNKTEISKTKVCLLTKVMYCIFL